MAKGASKTAGRFFSLSILLTSLIIAVAGLYILMANPTNGENSRLTMGLSAIVAILILLILSMMWKIIAGMEKIQEEETTIDSVSDEYE